MFICSSLSNHMKTSLPHDVPFSSLQYHIHVHYPSWKIRGIPMVHGKKHILRDPAGSHELPTVQLTAATWAERCGKTIWKPVVSWENGPHMDTNGGFFTSMLVYRRVCNDQRGISYPRFEELEVLLLMISIDILLPSSNQTDWYGKPVYYIPPGCLGLCILSSIFTLGISCMFHCNLANWRSEVTWGPSGPMKRVRRMAVRIPTPCAKLNHIAVFEYTPFTKVSPLTALTQRPVTGLAVQSPHCPTSS